MERLNEQNEQYIINTIQNNSKQKDKKITKEVYSYFFSQDERVQELVQKYNLNNFIISNQKTELNYYFYYFNSCRSYFWHDWDKAIIVHDFNILFISFNYYTVGQSVTRKDRISLILDHLVPIGQEKERLQIKYKKYKQELERRRQEERKKEELREKKRQENRKKRQKNREISKIVSKKINTALPSKYSILSTSNKKYSFENPTYLLDIAVVYGIVIQSNIVYIGSTSVLSQRIKQHEQCVKNKDIKNFQQKFLYEEMRRKDYQFVVLFSGEKVINKQQLQNIQFGYITKYHPKYNYRGVRSQFVWQDKDSALDRISWEDWIKYKNEND